MADAQNQYSKPVIFQGANQVVVSNAVFPELTEGAVKSFADSPRIIQFSNAMVEELQKQACLVAPVLSGLPSRTQSSTP
jgi:hypothetical protein